MNKYIILILFFFIVPAKSEIAYIDINFILNSSEVGKSLNNYIKKISDEKNNKFKNIESELIKKEQSIIAQQNILEKKEFENKITNLSKEVNLYRTNKKKTIDEINNLRIQNSKKILNLINPIITKYVDERSISLVLPKKI